MSVNCADCGGVLNITGDAGIGEIVECLDCGLEYVIEEANNGTLILKELTLKGEDWGE